MEVWNKCWWWVKIEVVINGFRRKGLKGSATSEKKMEIYGNQSNCLYICVCVYYVWWVYATFSTNSWIEIDEINDYNYYIINLSNVKWIDMESWMLV